MSVPNQSPISIYVGNAVTTVFAYTFLVTQAGDLVVEVNGVPQTLGVNYTVSGLGSNAGGDVTFISGSPAAGTAVTLYRKIVLIRTTDYQYVGDFQAATINADLDRLWMALQGAGLNSDRAVLLPFADTASPMTLPSVAQRAGMFLAFNALGQAVAAAGATGLPASAFIAPFLLSTTAAAARLLLAVAPRAARIDVASVAGVVDLTTNAPNTDDIRITGALAITGFTLADGRVVRVTAGGAFTLTNGANLVTQTGANIVCAVGDTFSLRGLAAGVVEVLSFSRAAPIVIPPQKIINVVEAAPYATYSSAADAGIYDNSIPQLSEGTALMSVSITPTSATSRLRVEFLGHFGVNSGGNPVVVAMYRDSTANAVTASAVTIAPFYLQPLPLVYEVAASSTAATTFSIRFSGSGTVAYVNGNSVERKLGGAIAATLRVTEIAA